MAKRARKRKSQPTTAARLPSVAGTVPDWAWGLVLVAAVVIAYLPVWWAGYLWDDDTVFTHNPCVIGPLGLKEIWTTNAADICPMTLTTFWVEHALWGLAPLPYHLVNVLFHAAGAVALWRVLRRLRVPGAWLGAALWALHPVQVDSVAWVTEMKNTESGLFFLLTILFFIAGLENRSRWGYALTLLLAALAITSKSSTIVLPLVLLLCAWWLKGRCSGRDVIRVAPIFLMSLAAGLVSIWTQKLAGAGDPQWARGWPERLATAGDVIWFYLGKLIWPRPLMTIYPRWQVDAASVVSYLPSLAVLIALAFLWSRREAWTRAVFFAAGYFVLALVPVLGFVDLSFFPHSFVADHFQYLASMGPLALAAAGLVRLEGTTLPAPPWLRASLGAGLLLVLGVVSWQRAGVYQDEDTLWSDTLAKNPACWVGYNNYGVVLSEKGEKDAAIANFQKSVELNPNYTAAQNNLGFALAERGDLDGAMIHFQQALRTNPHMPQVHYNLGEALARKGRLEEAAAEEREALSLDPNLDQARHDLGNIYVREGRLNDAVDQYRMALALNPGDISSANNLGNILLQQGKVDDAIALFQKALAIDPRVAQVWFNLGNALAKKGDDAAAVEQYRHSLEVDGRYPQVHDRLGLLLLKHGQAPEAIAQFQAALQLSPNDRDTQAHLAQAKALAK